MEDSWERNAEYIKGMCGDDFVDYDDGCYYCPECGEPIYEDDWTSHELAEFLCPVCGWEGE